MRVETAFFSSSPPNKEENEDSLLPSHIATDKGVCLFAIADGIGGHEGGACASKTAINKIEENSPKNKSDLEHIYHSICGEIKKISLQNKILAGMGTTLSCLILNGQKATTAHVGDSRIYHLRNNGILKMTKDQTEVQKLLDDGVLTKARAKNYPRKNVLLSALTSKDNFSFESVESEVLPGDRFILLTDGAYHVIGLKELRDFSIANSSVEAFKEAVLSCVEDRNPRDDYSAIFVEVK